MDLQKSPASGVLSPGVHLALDVDSRRRHRALRWSSAVAALAAGSFVLAACGSSSSASTTTSGSNSGVPAAFKAYETCLSQHGVTLHIPSGGFTHGTGTRPSTFPGGGTTPPTDFPHTHGSFAQTPAEQAAETACASLRPAGGFGGGYGGPGGGANNPNFAAYLTCLSTHGVSIPAGSTSPSALAGIDRTSASFEAANAACAPLLTTPSSSSSTSTSSATSSTS